MKKLKNNNIDKEQFWIFNVGSIGCVPLTIEEKEELVKTKELFYRNMQEGKLIG